ncbi:MAG: hypothetical protein IJK23_07150 [Clostridia bacterium]|nr:hypothetical protein [Clostridia bacterium]
MGKILSNDPDLCFAALKLIEQLNHDGHLPAYMFRNIMNDYAGIVDLSKFTVMEIKKEKEEETA